MGQEARRERSILKTDIFSIIGFIGCWGSRLEKWSMNSRNYPESQDPYISLILCFSISEPYPYSQNSISTSKCVNICATTQSSVYISKCIWRAKYSSKKFLCSLFHAEMDSINISGRGSWVLQSEIRIVVTWGKHSHICGFRLDGKRRVANGYDFKRKLAASCLV